MAGQHLGIADLASRMAPMAEKKPKKWIKKATSEAEEKKDAGDGNKKPSRREAFYGK